MKVRKFYPKQVINKLKVKNVELYNEGETAALEFFYRKSRKYGWSMLVGNNASYEDLDSFLNPFRLTVVKSQHNG